MSVFSFVERIAGTVIGVGKILLPIVRALRQGSPVVDDAISKIEDIIELGGGAADDVFDRNRAEITAAKDYCHGAAAVFTGLEEVLQECLDASAEYDDTPDSVTPEEAQAIALKLWELKPAIEDIFKRGESAITPLATMR